MSSAASFWARAGLLLLLALVFTLCSVARSKHKGRLSTSLNYDDVVYIESGLDIDNRIKEQGLRGISLLLRQRGLHSPYSETLAALALAPMGFHPSAPYYANGLLVLAYLSLLAYFFRPLNFLLFAVLSFTFLFLPFATMSVVEFRPDLAWATVLGFAIVYAVSQAPHINVNEVLIRPTEQPG